MVDACQMCWKKEASKLIKTSTGFIQVCDDCYGVSNYKYSKAIKRRAIWFEAQARRDKEISKIKEKIDEYFDENERGRAYAMAADMLTLSYPFDREEENDEEAKKTQEIIRKKYGFEPTDSIVVMELIQEIFEEKEEE